MNLVLPKGAEPIVKLRMKREKPADMLIVSLIGPVGESNHTIYANPAGTYDWRWLIDLKVCIYYRPGVDFRPITNAIAKARPEWFAVWDVDQFKGHDVWYLPEVKDIDKPKEQWRWKVDLVPWIRFENEQFAWGE